ncbi:MAG TPA: tetratricopeptide repeat protein, partial [Emticicia sp.]
MFASRPYPFLRFAIVLLFFCNAARAQYPDSLWRIYNNNTEVDSKRLNAIKAVTVQYLRGKPDSAIIVAQMQLALAQKLNNKRELADAYSYLGTGYYYTGNYPASIKNHTSSLKLSEELNLKEGIASSHNNIGILYFEQKSHEKALQEFNASLKVYKELKDTVQIASITGNMGNLYYSMNKYSESLITNKEALYLLQHSKASPFIIANTINNIGVAYQGLKNYPEARHYFLDALKIREEAKDELGVEISWANLASLYTTEKNYKEAEKCADKALAMATAMNDQEGIK